MSQPSSEPTQRSSPGLEGFRSILVPVDLTAASDRVLARLCLLPLARDAQLTLLHVVPGSLPVREQRRAEHDARKLLAEETRHVRGLIQHKVRVVPRVEVGAAAKKIAACAAELKAELIVMGRGGGRAVRETFLGSTAERVVRQSRRPVLVVRLPARKPYRRPALALELHASAHELIRLMLRMLPPPRPRLEVIHAFHAPYHGMVYPSLSVEDAEERELELRAHAVVKVGKLLSAALEKANIPPADAPFWNTHVRHGSPRSVVRKAVTRSEADLLVLGTRGYSGAAYVFLGSVAGELLRAAPCDVLIVPPAGRA
ncbi:MAG TPA: universal stress protein [Polyangiales bacterium]|nr:universal stress protein [Polyangiales bacterium]